MALRNTIHHPATKIVAHSVMRGCATATNRQNGYALDTHGTPRHGLADIALRWVLRRVERLDLEFTFPITSRNIEPELSSKPLGAANLSDAAMLIPITTDLHLATLQGAEDVTGVSIMVFYGVCRSREVVQVVYSK
jgi:hypothetical protein